ncbi:MAG TPA: amino acid adenylation domain-containing protein [Polyangiaceae bacterium]|nr:amino acid adenylation domain-containing protein [Polyangiaceae bacterium]
MLLAHERFELLASAAPDACAVRFRDASLSYGELNARANELSRYLVGSGVRPETPVIVALEPGLEIVVALLGVLKAGGVYVPLDPSYPEARKSAILEDISPAIVLTHSDLLPALPLAGRRAVALDRAAPELARLPDADLNLRLRPEQSAYVFYTSGSTGTPKGVLGSQANLESYLRLARERYGFGSTDVMVALARFSFSISLFELLSPLLAGGTLLVLERAHVLDLERLSETLQQVTCVHAGPSLLRGLLKFIRRRHADFSVFDGVRHASSGGDLVPVDVLASLREVFGQADVFVIYGCSEVSCMGTTYEALRGAPVLKTYVGSPFAGVTLLVADEELRPVPPGEVGEVWLAGPGVVKGYWRREQLTAELFREHAGQRFYRTRDCGRLNDQGLLELLGRSDFQVKLGGMRIELGEIEQQLRRAPGVDNAAVVAKPRPDGEKMLVAYVTRSPGDERSDAERAAALRQHLAEQLPEHMLPARIATLEALPLNLNAKLDRKALQELPLENALPRAGAVRPPRTASERALAALFERALALEGVGLDDHFFDLGGTSSSALQLIVEVQRELGVTLGGLELLREPLEMLAALCDRRSGRPVHDAVGSRSPDPGDVCELFHFGRDQSLFGVLHGPKASSVERAVLVCAPLGHEYLRAHFVLQRLARRLAAQGTPVLRFDYYGCCDSLGESVDATCSRWQSDIVAACGALVQRTGARQVVGVGVRLGATLLASVASVLELSALVLWDPVERGDQHLAELRHAHRARMQSALALGRWLPSWRLSGKEELLGATYSRALLRELNELVLPSASELACPVQRWNTDCAWLDLAHLEDMLPDPGISQTLQRFVDEAASQSVTKVAHSARNEAA